MRVSTSLLRILFFAPFYFVLAARPVAAQSTQYANGVVKFSGTVTKADSAVDQNIKTAAVLQPSSLTGSAIERVQFPSPLPAGNTNSGLWLQISSSSVASVLNSITVTSYSQGVKKESWNAGNLITLNILNPGQKYQLVLSPAPTAAFDQLELTTAYLANVAYSVKFFEAFGPSPAPLPVQLVSFQGQATAAGVQLSWQTASELHSSHFVVERATADAEFVALGQVAGAGSSSQAHGYQYVDAQPNALNYYRLRQVDADGQAHYSAVVAVRAAAVALAAYPSPATTTLLVASPTATQLGLYNQQGQLMQQATLAAGQQPFDVGGLPAGVYYLREASTGHSVRFVKAP